MAAMARVSFFFQSCPEIRGRRYEIDIKFRDIKYSRNKTSLNQTSLKYQAFPTVLRLCDCALECNSVIFTSRLHYWVAT